MGLENRTPSPLAISKFHTGAQAMNRAADNNIVAKVRILIFITCRMVGG